MPAKQKVSIVTLGCPKNQVDTQNLTRLLRARGYDVVTNPAEADAIVIHTCSFIEAAKKESVETILQAAQLKTKGKKLLVTGCLVQQHGPSLLDELPEVDAFLGTGQLSQVPDFLDKPRDRFLDRANPGGFMDPDVPRTRQTTGPTAYLRLSEGCSHPCSFCVIPRIRGPVQSRREEAILQEARELAAQGVEEFLVIAQDTGDWGRDFKATGRLPALLRSVSRIPSIRWIRLMYMHPISFSDALLETLVEQPKKFPYLDIPLQHIDSRVLSEMQRKTDESDIRHLLDRLHSKAPHLSLRTTFIVGFPGETDAQFDRLLHFVQEGHFDYLGAFAYSPEEETPAARRTDQIPEDVKQERLAALTEAYYDVALAKAQQRIGQVETVLLEDSEAGDVFGRTCREAPEIDAVVRLLQKTVEPRGGRFIQAKLTGFDAYEFSAEPV
ncbi:MAG: 30S ribosomal protein S12 methylthiotransferase RimO [Elusimicrobiota bacterium]|jgi:ribosomal protein S12 methylthiotransferase